MKKVGILLSAIATFAMLSFTVGDINKAMPSVDVKTLDGKIFNTSDIKNDGKPVFVSFWATWCTNCIKELNAIAEVYDDWQDETGVTVYAVSIDDRMKDQVGPFAAKQGWEYELLLDENRDFFRAMNGSNPPYSFIIDGKGNVVWEHTGYHEGDEDIVKSVLDKLAQ